MWNNISFQFIKVVHISCYQHSDLFQTPTEQLGHEYELHARIYFTFSLSTHSFSVQSHLSKPPSNRSMHAEWKTPCQTMPYPLYYVTHKEMYLSNTDVLALKFDFICHFTPWISASFYQIRVNSYQKLVYLTCMSKVTPNDRNLLPSCVKACILSSSLLGSQVGLFAHCYLVWQSHSRFPPAKMTDLTRQSRCHFLTGYEPILGRMRTSCTLRSHTYWLVLYLSVTRVPNLLPIVFRKYDEESVFDVRDSNLVSNWWGK